MCVEITHQSLVTVQVQAPTVEPSSSANQLSTFQHSMHSGLQDAADASPARLNAAEASPARMDADEVMSLPDNITEDSDSASPQPQPNRQEANAQDITNSNPIRASHNRSSALPSIESHAQQPTQPPSQHSSHLSDLSSFPFGGQDTQQQAQLRTPSHDRLSHDGGQAEEVRQDAQHAIPSPHQAARPMPSLSVRTTSQQQMQHMQTLPRVAQEQEAPAEAPDQAMPSGEAQSSAADHDPGQAMAMAAGTADQAMPSGHVSDQAMSSDEPNEAMANAEPDEAMPAAESEAGQDPAELFAQLGPNATAEPAPDDTDPPEEGWMW